MSIGGIMRTSVSGMNAQATRLSTVSENIANSDTTGYKRSDVEFSSLVLPSSGAGYNSGSVEAQVRSHVSEQGGLSQTGNSNNPKSIDLALSGNGFLAVSDGAGGTYLTRAGSFTQLSNGTMVNAAGYILQGYPVSSTGTDRVLNGFAGLTDVNLRTSLLSANPSTKGALTVPLNKNFVVPGSTGTYTPASDFSNTQLAVGEGLQFSVKLDGAAVGIDVKVAPSSSGARVTAADIVKAINDTGGLADVASLVNGKIVLTSNSTKTGVNSSVSVANVLQYTPMRAATLESTAPITVVGLAPISQTGTAGVNATALQSSGYDPTLLTSGKGLRFTVKIDQLSPVTVEVAGVPGAKPDLATVKAAITAAVGATATVSDVGGKIQIVSATPGVNSGVVLSNVLEVTPADNGTAGGSAALAAGATLAAVGFGNFPASDATGVNAKRPTDNTALKPSKDSTISTSMTVYNNAGEPVKLDIHYTKTNDAANTWEVAVFDGRTASKGPASPFPYGVEGTPPLASANLTFDSGDYSLKTIEPTSGSIVSAKGVLSINLASIGGTTNFNLDIGKTTQYAGNTQPTEATVDGNPAEVIKNIAVSADGTITAVFSSGTSRDLFKVPVAQVASPDTLIAKAGNAYAVGVESGTVLMGFGGSAGFGSIQSGALEDSTVDLASELTTMIESQRSYTANSKVFQTGSEILDVLVNLKR